MSSTSEIKKGSDPNIIIGIGCFTLFISIFLPYINGFFGLISFNGTRVPIGVISIIITIIIAGFAAYKYSISKTKQEMVFARLIGFLATVAGGVSIFIYYVSFGSTADQIITENINLSPFLDLTYISFGIGFYGFALGTGLILFGSILITTYISYKPKQTTAYSDDPQFQPEYEGKMVIKQTPLSSPVRKRANFCPNCGDKLLLDAKFCTNCGLVTSNV